MKILTPLPFLLFLALVGCGSGSDSGHFVMDPETPVVNVGEPLKVTARPAEDLAGEMEWEVVEPYGGGLLRSQGPTAVYMPPDAAGTYHLMVRAQRADGRKIKQAVEVTVLGTSTLEPSHARVAPGGTVAFRVQFRGAPRESVVWAVEEPGGGEIDGEGRYQAPSRPGTFHVTATAAGDPRQSARATVVVSR